MRGVAPTTSGLGTSALHVSTLRVMGHGFDYTAGGDILNRRGGGEPRQFEVAADGSESLSRAATPSVSRTS